MQKEEEEEEDEKTSHTLTGVASISKTWNTLSLSPFSQCTPLSLLRDLTHAQDGCFVASPSHTNTQQPSNPPKSGLASKGTPHFAQGEKKEKKCETKIQLRDTTSDEGWLSVELRRKLNLS